MSVTESAAAVPAVASDSQLPTPDSRLCPEPLPANIRSTQPGGGFCYSVELVWGRWRRWYLKAFQRQYVRRMRELRHGEPIGVPHEVLDPRDLKFFRNQTDCHWDPADDPFRWRDRIGFARWGLAELQIFGWPLFALVVAGLLSYWYLALIPGLVLALVLYFFRDPARTVPQGAGPLVAPADGKVVEIIPVDDDPFIGEPAVRIAIFLSLLNVHVNRSPCSGRVIALRYARGQFISAMNPDCALKNENMWIGLEDASPRRRRWTMRQVAGAVARRIVCDLRPGQTIGRGDKFGMIKFGSRTELTLPRRGLEITVKVGQAIRGGRDVIGHYAE